MQSNDELVERLSASMEGINARIARLASALNVPLSDQQAVNALMAAPPHEMVDSERRRARMDLAQVSVSSECRQAHQHEELRGLLVLRYRMETTSLDDNGLVVTREAMVLAEEHLIRQGFEPGADGVGLDKFFNVT